MLHKGVARGGLAVGTVGTEHEWVAKGTLWQALRLDVNETMCREALVPGGHVWLLGGRRLHERRVETRWRKPKELVVRAPETAGCHACGHGGFCIRGRSGEPGDGLKVVYSTRRCTEFRNHVRRWVWVRGQTGGEGECLGCGAGFAPRKRGGGHRRH